MAPLELAHAGDLRITNNRMAASSRAVRALLTTLQIFVKLIQQMSRIYSVEHHDELHSPEGGRMKNTQDFDGAVLAPSTVRCCNCDCEITEELQSPELGVCTVCLFYRQDCEAEQLHHERQVQVTREMARDGGCPEMEGVWITR